MPPLTSLPSQTSAVFRLSLAVLQQPAPWASGVYSTSEQWLLVVEQAILCLVRYGRCYHAGSQTKQTEEANATPKRKSFSLTHSYHYGEALVSLLYSFSRLVTLK
ncbi:hypothetical protein E2C01_014598 [Portunus trituberculatus]|uniref:Uncharacterized protein n=1 Tax=Portunus trituberculatus TaxID=210409 RepID=A0A5B7DKL9_PORTR|nr:hypothetical protein [Portunus trituberculatus]